MNNGPDLEEFHIDEAELYERLPEDLHDLQEQEMILVQMKKTDTEARKRIKRIFNIALKLDQNIEAALRAVQARIRNLNTPYNITDKQQH